MTESVRPPLWPQVQRPAARPAAAPDPRAAFFQQALDRAGAASPSLAPPPEPARAAVPARPAVEPAAADPTRPARPGSLLNIRV